MTRVLGEETVIVADDGRELAGRWYVPDGDPVGAAIIAPAMAVPGRFYDRFAEWLRAQGLLTLTFDLRGIGASATGRLRDEPADVLRWAGDAAAALRHLVDRVDGLPITWIGHSLGSQIVPLVDHGALAKVVSVASGSGYWRLAPPRLRRTAPLLWYVLAPASTRVLGYYPGSRFGVVGDLPPAAMRQWTRWCRHRDYIVSESPDMPSRFASVTTPFVAMSFTDDEFMSEASGDALTAWYTGTDVVKERYTPDALGVPRIGHTGFFRSENRSLWNQVVLPYLPAPSP